MPQSTRPETRILVIQHAECEPPAAFEEVLLERGIDFDRVLPGEGESLPDWHGYDGIIVMGGPMSANDQVDWLQRELALIRDSVTEGTPFWGVCLGAQLLARALGAEVYEGPEPEIGMYPVRATSATAADRVFAGMPEELDVFQWHSDTFDLPAEATLIISSDPYPQQAFRWRNAYGIQFHLEVDPGLVHQWADLPEYAAALHALHGPGGLSHVESGLAVEAGRTLPMARAIFACWLEEVVEPFRRERTASRTEPT